MDTNTIISNTCLLVFVVACTRLWFYMLAHYKYTMVKRVELGKAWDKNTMTINQIIQKTIQEVKEEKDAED